MTKIKVSVLLVIAFTTSILLSCKKESIVAEKSPQQIVDDDLIYEFISSISTDTLGLGQCDKIADFDMLPYFLTDTDSLSLTGLDRLFAKADMDYIFKQAEYRNFRIKPDFLKNKNIIPIDTIKLFNSDRTPQDYYSGLIKEHGPICSIKIPLFSVDKQTVLVDISMSCGSLCGKGGRYIYKKVNGRWKLITTLDEWVS